MTSPQIPLSLYIHIPWCLKKCPYCDFNSHAQQNALPEMAYVARLLEDLEESLPLIGNRPLVSIFIGGGTPSLFSGAAIEHLLAGIHRYLVIPPNIEITLEANPGTFEQAKFRAYRAAGINRLSIGIQSLDPRHLVRLGRVHDEVEAEGAVEQAKRAGFEHINLDFMFGLPEQTLTESLSDLERALALKTSHLSWYQLTLEPNTWFYHHPPTLPKEDLLWEIQEQGQALLAAHGFHAYEISAYTQKHPCTHNRNYWEFGDYLGIGAGAHSKLTQNTGVIQRFVRVRHPKDYLDPNKAFVASQQELSGLDPAFEFMMNALRLKKGVPQSYFTERTGLPLSHIEAQLRECEQKGWISLHNQHIACTDLGFNYLNDVITFFLA